MTRRTLQELLDLTEVMLPELSQWLFVRAYKYQGVWHMESQLTNASICPGDKGFPSGTWEAALTDFESMLPEDGAELCAACLREPLSMRQLVHVVRSSSIDPTEALALLAALAAQFLPVRGDLVLDALAERLNSLRTLRQLFPGPGATPSSSSLAEEAQLMVASLEGTITELRDDLDEALPASEVRAEFAFGRFRESNSLMLADIDRPSVQARFGPVGDRLISWMRSAASRVERLDTLERDMLETLGRVDLTGLPDGVGPQDLEDVMRTTAEAWVASVAALEPVVGEGSLLAFPPRTPTWLLRYCVARYADTAFPDCTLRLPAEASAWSVVANEVPDDDLAALEPDDDAAIIETALRLFDRDNSDSAYRELTDALAAARAL